MLANYEAFLTMKKTVKPQYIPNNASFMAYFEGLRLSHA